jgi:hypothetical protein
VVPDPPDAPDLLVETIEAGSTLFHGHRRERDAVAFNPGPRPAGRFSFFEASADGRLVSAFYAGLNEEVAVAETLLHDVPLSGGQITWAEQNLRIISAVQCLRDLQLAQLHGGGLRRLGIKARELTDTGADEYPRTVRWAAAIHTARPDLDGLAWMSARWNSHKAVVLFGDRVGLADLAQDASVSRDFRILADREWLLDLLDSVNVIAMPPSWE